MFRAIQFVLVAVVLSGTCAVAQADNIPLLYNNTTGATVFDDNFEGHALGLFANQVTVNAPVGTWYARGMNDASTDRVAIVTKTDGGSYGGSPLPPAGFDANEGVQFLSVSRSDSSPPYALGTGVATNSGTGDLLTFTIAYHRQMLNDQLTMDMRDSNGAVLARIGLTSTQQINVGTSDLGAWQMLTQTSNDNAWNTLVVTHINGSSGWSLKVNDNSFETKTASTVNLGNWSQVYFKNGDMPSGYYLDAVVPEPSTLALLVTGLIGLLCYAWRKRK